jgi:hypothetical protein
MTDTVLVLDQWCLSTLPCKKHDVSICRISVLECLGSPAPGGPIKIIRIESEGDFGFFPPSPSLVSSWCTRASSLWTRSLRSETVLSVMGAMGKSRRGRGPDQGLDEEREKSKAAHQ